MKMLRERIIVSISAAQVRTQSDGMKRSSSRFGLADCQ
jgi:hypothetical protein